MAKLKTRGKFKTVRKDIVDAPVKDSVWEGEEVGVESKTKIQEDQGTGKPIILRFFEFAVNPKTFKEHKPTAQELFDSHRKGMEALLWTDGMAPYHIIEPRVQFSKDKTRYRFVVSCIPSLGNTLVDKTQTLSQLLIPK